MDISFDCDKCGKHLVIDSAGAGITIDCPECGKPVYVPSSARANQQDAPVRVEAASASRKAASAETPAFEDMRSLKDSRRVESPPFVPAKYGTLRVIAGLYKALAVVLGIAAALSLLLVIPMTARMGGGLTAAIEAIGVIIMAAFGVMLCLATAEGIRAFIDIEENTRATRLMLEQRFFSARRDTTPVADEPPHTSHADDQSVKSTGHAQFRGSSSSW
jgi:uncharacterized Zn finger protein (UPF0148 family)